MTTDPLPWNPTPPQDASIAAALDALERDVSDLIAEACSWHQIDPPDPPTLQDLLDELDHVLAEQAKRYQRPGAGSPLHVPLPGDIQHVLRDGDRPWPGSTTA